MSAERFVQSEGIRCAQASFATLSFCAYHVFVWCTALCPRLSSSHAFPDASFRSNASLVHTAALDQGQTAAREQAAVTESTLASITADVQHWRTECSRLEQELQTAASERTSTAERLSIAQAAVSRLESELASAQDALKAADAADEELRSEKAALEEQHVHQLASAAADAAQAYDRLQAELTEARRMLQQREAGTESAVQSLETRVSELVASTGVLQQQLAASEEKALLHVQRCEELEKVRVVAALALEAAQQSVRVYCSTVSCGDARA